MRGRSGTASRTIGLFGGILTYAVDAGIIETNPAFGIRKPQDEGARQPAYALDHQARKQAVANFLANAVGEASVQATPEEQPVA